MIVSSDDHDHCCAVIAFLRSWIMQRGVKLALCHRAKLVLRARIVLQCDGCEAVWRNLWNHTRKLLALFYLVCCKLIVDSEANAGWQKLAWEATWLQML